MAKEGGRDCSKKEEEEVVSSSFHSFFLFVCLCVCVYVKVSIEICYRSERCLRFQSSSNRQRAKHTHTNTQPPPCFLHPFLMSLLNWHYFLSHRSDNKKQRLCVSKWNKASEGILVWIWLPSCFLSCCRKCLLARQRSTQSEWEGERGVCTMVCMCLSVCV
jgi:hypothetical protein